MKENNSRIVERSKHFRALIQLLRPTQWVKNGFVLAPLFFSGLFLDLQSLIAVGFATVVFCIASSASYVLNDICDVPLDKLHPTKSRTRPLASGALSLRSAKALLLSLYVLLVVCAFINPRVLGVIAIYLTLNITYSFFLKHQPVIDIFCIALGFVLRVYAGAIALSVPVSPWMFITTLCLALYLASIKRRQELYRIDGLGRKVLSSYSIALVDRYAEISGSGALIFYSMFVITSRPELVVTVPMVIFGLFRYWFVVERLEGGESPTDALLSDGQLIFTVVLWLAVCCWALWPTGG